MANGDTANKIGTYSLSIACKHHGVPFFIAAPTTTIDADLASGELIHIEQRPPEEVRGCACAPPRVCAVARPARVLHVYIRIGLQKTYVFILYTCVYMYT